VVADKVRKTIWLDPCETVCVGAPKLSDALTCTISLSPVNPNAEALIVADPKSTPVTCGCRVGVVVPSRTMTFVGLTETLEVSLLVRVT